MEKVTLLNCFRSYLLTVLSFLLLGSPAFANTKQEFDAFAKIQAESYNTMLGIQSEGCADTDGGLNIGFTDDGDQMVFNNVDFGSGTVNSLRFRIASAATFTGFADVRIDSPTGTIIATVPFGNTGGWQTWLTKKVAVTPVSGIKNVYIIFRGDQPSIGNLNWFQFSTEILSTPEVPAGLTAVAGNAQATLNWSISPSGTMYNLKRSVTPGGPYTTTQAGIENNSYTNAGLTNGTTYYYVVSAVNSFGESNNSGQISVMPQVQIKVSCIGDSITFGAGVDPATQSYPVQLDGLLGDSYNVLNFGHSGATMLVNGDTPYWNQVAYTNAINSSPDIVVIKLGTNDSKAWNWGPYGTQYPTNYAAMIDVFRNLPSNPRIFIALPAKAFSDAFGISEPTLINSVRPYVVQVANEKGVSVIDVYDATKNSSANFPDGIHPNVAGAGQIAAKVHDIIVMPQPDITVNGMTLTAPVAYAYQWFKGNVKIQDAVGQSLIASSVGSYTVLVKVNAANEDRIISNAVEIGDSSTFPPGNPVALTAAAGNAEVSLAWLAGSNATSYNIKRATVAAGPFETVQTGVTGTTFINTGLQNGVTYFFTVTASNANGESSSSNTATATPYNGDAVINTANTFVIVSKAYGKVMDIVNGSVANGAKVQLNAWSDVNNKRWKFEATPDGYYRIYNLLSQKSIDVVDALSTNNTQMQQWDYFASPQQKWRVEDAGNGYVRIHSVLSGKLLDAGATGANGQIIFQYDGTGTDTQLWRLDLNTLDTYNAVKSKDVYLVYPSPANSVITIESTSGDNITQVKIYNALGMQVYSKAGIKEGRVTVPVSNLSNGVYTIVIGETNIPHKVIIAN